MKTEQLIQTLQELQYKSDPPIIIQEDAVIRASEEQKSAYSKIIIKILSILGGIIASLCFIGFLALINLLQSDEVLLLLGIISISGSLLLGRVVRNLVLDTIIICFYVLGIALFCTGIYGVMKNENSITISVFITGLLALIISERFIPVLLGALLMIGGFIGFFYVNELSMLLELPLILILATLVWLMLNEPEIISRGKKINLLFKPVQAGFFISFLASLLLVYHYPVYTMQPVLPWFASAAIWISIFAVVHMILKEMEVSSTRNQVIVYALTLGAAIPLFFAPYVSGALLAVLLCFHFGYITELMISLAFLVYGISRYYYDLHLTLLQKSGILCFSGLIFAALWYFVRSQNRANEKN